MKRDDDPPDRAYPVNLTIIRAAFDVLDTADPVYGTLNTHLLDLIVVAFYWLLRPAEYTQSTSADARSQAFQLRHVHLTIDGTIHPALSAPLNDASIQRISHAALEFADQKNAVRGERIGHGANSDPLICPAKALGRIAYRLKKWGATAETPLHYHYNLHPAYQGWKPTPSKYIKNALRHAAASIQKATGIDPKHICAKSLRPGGATALLCANVGSDAIMLLGRWKSDAMFRYLRVQAATSTYSQLMLDHGAYTFAPSTYASRGLPVEAPPAVAALLAPAELFDD